MIVLKTVRKGAFAQVCMIGARRESGGPYACPSAQFLGEHIQTESQYSESAKAIFDLFDAYAKQGRHGLTTDQFHEVDKKEKIYEFIKGDLRVLCFFDGGSLVVAANGFIKKTRKTPDTEKDVAIRWKNAFFAAKQRNQLELVP